MITLHQGDCRDVIRTLADNSIDSCVTDPPYALVSVVKRFGSPTAAPAKGNDAYMRASAGFMGCTWDVGETAFSVEFWAEVYRVLKPGAFVAAFGASRGYHRMACAIEDAGFEIRDSLMYIYGTGFPKSHNLDNKRGDLICGCETESPSERDVRSVSDDDVSAAEHAAQERGQVLQPSVPQSGAPTEMDIGASHENSGPLEGSAQSIMERRGLPPGAEGQLRIDEIRSMPDGLNRDGAQGRVRDGASSGHGAPLPLPPDANGMRASLGPRSEKQFACEPGTVAGQSLAQNGGAWPYCGRCGKPMVTRGLGSALKPAFEPIVLARKPLSEPTVAANVLKWRTGALNIDGCRVAGESTKRNNTAEMGYHGGNIATEYQTGSDAGRWPANVVHDGSDEVVGAFPSSKGQLARARNDGEAQNNKVFGALCHVTTNPEPRGDSGSTARFFYSAKASKADRAGSKHPTVKPISLMEWLATLITPPGGTVLDPFAGSGTTGAACRNKGFRAVLIEREDEYVADIRRRLSPGAPATPRLSHAELLDRVRELQERINARLCA